MYLPRMRWSLVLAVVLIACEDAPPKPAEDPQVEMKRVTGADLPPTRVPPCYAAPQEDGGSEVVTTRIRGVTLQATDVQSCVDESKAAGESPNGATTFMVSVGIDDRVSSIEVMDSCGISAHSILCFAQAFQRARVDAAAAMKRGTLQITFGEGRHDMRSASSDVGYTTVHDFTLRATDAFGRTRSAFDACARAASVKGKFDQTWGQFTMSLGPEGNVREIQVDPYAGDQSLLACAAEALQKVVFPPPPHGIDTLREHLAFEPPP